MDLKAAFFSRAINRMIRATLVVVLVLVFAVMELNPAFAISARDGSGVSFVDGKSKAMSTGLTAAKQNKTNTANAGLTAAKQKKSKKSGKNKKKSEKSKKGKFTKKDKSSKKPLIASTSGVLYCENTGEVLFEQKSRSRVAPLTTTKIITVILAIQNLQLSTEVEVSAKAASYGRITR